jgi:DNA-binding winged helix-turn-helix (wHTH) protein
VNRDTPELYEFGPFRLDPAERKLLRDNEIVALTPKAFDTLLLLVRNSGHLLGKDELIRMLWPDSFVEEGNLSNNIFLLRKALGEDPPYIETVPKRGYRFVGAMRQLPLAASPHLGKPPDRGRSFAASSGPVAVPETPADRVAKLWKIAVPVLLVALLLAGGLYYRSYQQRKRLAEKDTIVLADFANSTGDPIFDDTLKTALNVSLRQSPFLNVLSDSEVAKALQLMTLPASTKLTPEVALDLCQRAGSKANLAGSIGSLGSEYVLGLKAVNCRSGDTLAQEQVTAATKEKVLDALGEVASKLRGELGESLSTVQKYDVALEQATTPSLDALKAYTVAWNLHDGGSDPESIPFFKHAIELDPNFALAYAALGQAYANIGEEELGAQYVKQAFERRERISEREKFYITASYYVHVIGDDAQAIQTYELWAKTYPRDDVPPNNLAHEYSSLGQHEKALQKAGRLDPILGFEYLALNRFDEAPSIFEQGLAHRPDDEALHAGMHVLASLSGDARAVERQAAWALGRPEAEGIFFGIEAYTAAYYGNLAKCREFFQRSLAADQRDNLKASAAVTQATAALLEAEYGNLDAGRKGVTIALTMAAPSEPAKILAALTFAELKDGTRAEQLASEVGQRFPNATLLNNVWLPAIHAQLATSRDNPTQAIKLLQAALPYELALHYEMGRVPPPIVSLYPVYLRGQAYLQAKQGGNAAQEFRKILDHRGITWNSPVAPLAHLGLARAYVLSGDTTKAKTAYQDLFALWKDADPDIPILKEAKAEYAKLQ